MSKIEVNQITQQCGTTLTVGGGACKTAVVDATTVTLGRCGATVSLASGATQSGFGRTGTVDWITTPKVTGDSPVTGVTGNGYFMNTTAGTITLNLPAGSAGDIVSLMDYAATWNSNKVTVSPNGSEKIGSVNADVDLTTAGQSITLVYVDSTQGWLNTMDSTSNVRASDNVIATGGTITCCGDFKMHRFTGPGTFCVSAVSGGTPANNVVSYLVVAGGGASSSAGGGAGGFREYKSPVDTYTASPLDGNPGGTAITVTATGYPITVGGGASSGTPAYQGGPYAAGSNSVFSSITSAGGGSGGDGPQAPPTAGGGAGGSGGGAGNGPAGSGAGGAGNTPPTTPAQGFAGGTSSPAPINATGYGGGGGATAVGTGGTTGPAPAGGNAGSGGAGATTSIIAAPTAYAGGGGGAAQFGSCGGAVGNGGAGGGGSGRKGPGTAGCNGTAYTGGGGGGVYGCGDAGGTGGDGVVIIRYKFQ